MLGIIGISLLFGIFTHIVKCKKLYDLLPRRFDFLQIVIGVVVSFLFFRFAFSLETDIAIMYLVLALCMLSILIILYNEFKLNK